MKHLRLTVFIILLSICFAKAQIDTTDWFPMQTGNYWEYMAWDSPPKYFSTKVIGDTLMPNGKEYKVFYTKHFANTSDFTLFYRKETDSVFLYTGINSYFPLGEFKFLDFVASDSTIWLIIPIYICCNPNARGIATTFYDNTYFNFLQKLNEGKQFEDVYIDSTDTLWTPNDGSFPIVLNKGLGIVWHFIFNDGSYYLQGAIINGVRMGVITDIEYGIEIAPIEYYLSQNFPNPFNPSTKISWQSPVGSWQTLKVYDILGNEVATLVNEYRNAGSYENDFNASLLASGIYYYQLRAGDYVETKKMILLK